MYTTPRLQAVITALAQRHGMELSRTGAYLRLQQPGSGHLVLENIGAGRVSLTNYVPVSGDLLADPEVVLYTDYQAHEGAAQVWTPLEITQFFRGWRLAAELDAHGALLVHDPVLQAELADFCERVLAAELQRQGWLDSGVAVNVTRTPWTVEEMQARDIRPEEEPDTLPIGSGRRATPAFWPEPTVEEPDWDTLEQWLWEDGGCETSDGCWTDPDGTCPHGHPSWFLRMGLI
jgi:hypothetical protein